MKSTTYALPAAAILFASTSLAYGPPDCNWSSCVGSWNGTSCSSKSGWDCVCSDPSSLDTLNKCIETSCSKTADQEAIYQAIDQLCANAGATPTAAPEASFSATSGGSAYPTITGAPNGWGSGSSGWSSWVSALSTGLPGPPGSWSSGSGPWGGPGSGWNSQGPWGGSDCNWSTWTAGWGPWSSWTGTWSGCGTSTTASPSAATVTTTVNGQVVTGTTFGVQAAVTASQSIVASDSGNGAAGPAATGLVKAQGAMALALVGAVLAL